jgi:hypothetical protein
MFHNLLDYGLALYVQPADCHIVNRCSLAGVFAVFNVVAALPYNFFASVFTVPNPPAQWRSALPAQQHPSQRIAVLILIFCFPDIAFGLSTQSDLSLRFIPDFFAYDGRMVILDIKAVDLAMIDALLFAEVILAVSLLQLGISFVLLILEDA